MLSHIKWLLQQSLQVRRNFLETEKITNDRMVITLYEITKKSCIIATLHKNCWSPRVELGITQGMSLVWFIYPFHPPAMCLLGLEPKTYRLKADYSTNWVIDTRTDDDTTRTVAPPPIWEKMRNVMNIFLYFQIPLRVASINAIILCKHLDKSEPTTRRL